MIDRFAKFSQSLRSRVRSVRLGASQVPTLLAHPDWKSPAPTVLWMHGRTVSKELDSGRYLRWIRGGIAAVAVDLPGHGERFELAMQHPRRSLDVVAQMVSEVDSIVAALGHNADVQPCFDLSRLAIGGMSAGGMAALRRLCAPHPFSCASVEGTTGWLGGLYLDEPDSDDGARTQAPWAVAHDPATVKALDPFEHLRTWRPIPLLALHSEADRIIPVAGMRRFMGALQRQYEAQGNNSPLTLATWPETGAPAEHAGFGRVANEAKSLQIAFLSEHLRPIIPSG